MKTMVVGGYGNFGARICRALAGHPQIQLIVAGRDAARARAAASAFGHGAVGVGFDVSATRRALARKLSALGIELVIHTAGPFQAQDYRVAEAAADAGLHYIDLADGRRFVCDFPQALQRGFERAGRVGISGASTVPGLSSAVIDHLCAGWRRIDTIDTCIAPAQTAPRGIATLRGVLSYCGEPIEVWHGGRWQRETGWANPREVDFMRMATRRGALCDIPDLELFPRHYAVLRRVMFRAALEVDFAQGVFARLAAWRAGSRIPQPARFAPLLAWLGRPLDAFGSSLGGMVVRVGGRDEEGNARRMAWHIAADQDHGPEIPCMSAILLARRLAARVDASKVPNTTSLALRPGAYACMSLLKLADFEPEFERWGMVTDIEDESIDTVETASGVELSR